MRVRAALRVDDGSSGTVASLLASTAGPCESGAAGTSLPLIAGLLLLAGLPACGAGLPWGAGLPAWGAGVGGAACGVAADTPETVRAAAKLRARTEEN